METTERELTQQDEISREKSERYMRLLAQAEPLGEDMGICVQCELAQPHKQMHDNRGGLLPDFCIKQGCGALAVYSRWDILTRG